MFPRYLAENFRLDGVIPYVKGTAILLRIRNLTHEIPTARLIWSPTRLPSRLLSIGCLHSSLWSEICRALRNWIRCTHPRTIKDHRNAFRLPPDPSEKCIVVVPICSGMGAMSFNFWVLRIVEYMGRWIETSAFVESIWPCWWKRFTGKYGPIGCK